MTPGNKLTATWEGIAPPSNRDWVGLYPSGSTADAAYLAWGFTSGAAGGSLELTVPANAPHGTTYELRLFANNTWTRLGTSPAFRVK